MAAAPQQSYTVTIHFAFFFFFLLFRFSFDSFELLLDFLGLLAFPEAGDGAAAPPARLVPPSTAQPRVFCTVLRPGRLGK